MNKNKITYEERLKLHQYNIDNNILWPIIYDGKLYNEEDCDDIFLATYCDPYSYVMDVGVYMSEGLYVSPTGEFEEY